MKTNLALLTLAIVFGIGVAGAQNYPPPYECYIYYCQTGTTCQAASGTCGDVNNPYNYQTVVPKGVGFCELQEGQGCTDSSLAICNYVYDYYVTPQQTTCDNNVNLQCGYPTYESGCN